MAIPEYDQQPSTSEQIQQRAEQIDLPQDIEQGTGASVVQQTPQPLTDPEDDRVIAQPVPDPQDQNGPSITIPEYYQSEEQLEKYTHGSASDSITWQAVGLVRKIHMAVRKGWRVIFNQS